MFPGGEDSTPAEEAQEDEAALEVSSEWGAAPGREAPALALALLPAPALAE